MEYNYYRELKHNYLVFEKSAGDAKENDSYQYRIAQSGRIRGLLPCSERNINGNTYCYYEIGSMQTLKDRYMTSRMDGDTLRHLLECIKSTLESLSEFLLGEEVVVFNTGNIYTDLSTGEFGFIFCPFFDEQKSFSDFTVQLLEIIDESDEKATEMAYRLCEEAAEKGEFTYEILSEVLEGSRKEEINKADESTFKKPVELTEDPTAGLYSFDDDDAEDEEETAGKKNSGIRRANEKLSGKFQVLLSLLFFGVIAAMMYVRMNFVLSGEENIMSIVVMLVSAISGVVSLIGGSRQMKKAKTGGADAEAFDEDEDDTEEDFEEQDTGDFTSFGEEPCGESAAAAAVSNSGRRNEWGGGISPERLSGSDETVVLDDDMNMPLTLFSRNLDKTVRIALDKLPVTVGKLPECVDKVIPDMSISRMHCRIVSDGAGVGILDLGSTNGTYRNGVRLRPQEIIHIEEGDEIRIGRVCFDCR
ncbi:MAG: FHA domain-containing protein [Butyrivibrio sp.]|nr:FHA domain-containing protein [Butyrivibrio sp.]